MSLTTRQRRFILLDFGTLFFAGIFQQGIAIDKRGVEVSLHFDLEGVVPLYRAAETSAIWVEDALSLVEKN